MHLYCICQILVFNAINTIVTDIECNIRIDRLPLGRVMDQWKWYCLRRRLEQYHFHWSVPRPLGSLYILIFPSISVTIIKIYLVICVKRTSFIILTELFTTKPCLLTYLGLSSGFVFNMAFTSSFKGSEYFEGILWKKNCLYSISTENGWFITQ